MSYNTTEDLRNELKNSEKSFENTKKQNLNQGARTQTDLYPKTAMPATYETVNNIVASILADSEYSELIKEVEDKNGVSKEDKLGDNPIDWFYESQSPVAQKSREEVFSQLSNILTEDNFFGGCDDSGTSTYLSANEITTNCRYNPCDQSTHTTDAAKCAVEKAALPGIQAGLVSGLENIKDVDSGLILDVLELAKTNEQAAIDKLANAIYDPVKFASNKGWVESALPRIKTQKGLEEAKERARKLLEQLENRRQTVENAVQNSPYGGVNIGFKEQCFFLAHLQTFMALRGKLRGVIREEQLGRHFFEKKMPSVNEDGAQGNRCMQLHGEPFGFINKLTQSPSKSYFFDRIDAAALSTLQPMIRLFKVETDENGREYTVELNFDSYSRDIALSLQTQGKRGSGVGINDFSFAYEATNPFGIKKTITSKLSIFANSFNELLAPRYGTGTYDDGTLKTEVTYQYTDLALKTTSQTFKKAKFNPQNADVALRDYEKVNFRLKAVVGYAAPYSGNGNNFDYNAIYNSFVTLNLTPTIHEFKIDETGRVTFDINYLAYVEDFFDHPSFNIFTDPDIAIQEMERRFNRIIKDQKCKASQSSDEDRAAERAKIEEEKLANFNALIRNMVHEDKVHQLDIKLGDLAQYQTTGPLLPVDEELLKFLVDKYNITVGLNAEVFKVPEDSENGSSNTGATSSDEKFTSNPIENIPFFWASDMIDVILKYIGRNLDVITTYLKTQVGLDAADGYLSEQGQFYSIELLNYQAQLENFKRFRVLLGPMEVVNPVAKDGEPVSIISNLGDIPISVKYFLEWLTNKVLKTDRQIYPLPVFLNQFFNNFIRDFLNNDTCFGNAAKQKVRMGQASISAYNTLQPVDPPTPYVDDIQYLMEQQGNRILDLTNAPQPVLSVMGYRDDPRIVGTLNQETNYLVYYASRVQPVEKMQGNRTADNSRGIFHYLLGSDKGIIKNITLNKNNAPGLAELRFEQEGYDGLAQLLVLYDAGIKTYFDASAFPGNYIYVEPKGFDPSLGYDITKLGIGGYFMIIKSEHSLKAGFAETNITAKWVAQIESNENKTEQEIADQKSCEERQSTRKETVSVEGFEQSLSGVPGLGFLSDFLGGVTKKPTDNGASGSEGDPT